MLLARLIQGEMEERADQSEAEFQNVLFAVNPTLWEKLYGESAQQEQIEQELEWITPDHEDFGGVLDELRAMGYID